MVLHKWLVRICVQIYKESDDQQKDYVLRANTDLMSHLKDQRYLKQPGSTGAWCEVETLLLDIRRASIFG